MLDDNSRSSDSSFIIVGTMGGVILLLVIPGDPDVPISTNPSYSVPAKPYSKTSKDEHNYEQPDEFNQYSGLEVTVTMDVNPSYGISTANGVQQIKEGECGVFNQPNNDYEITHAITNSQQTIMKNANPVMDADSSYGISTGNCARPSNKDEYCVANQLEYDDIDYKITHDITANQ